jgi:hypothetical protein
VNVVVVLAFLWFIHRERERHAAVLAAFAKDAHDREQGLLQRIQAPAAEVVRYHYDREQVDIPPAVRPTMSRAPTRTGSAPGSRRRTFSRRWKPRGA